MEVLGFQRVIYHPKANNYWLGIADPKNVFRSFLRNFKAATHVACKPSGLDTIKPGMNQF